MFLLASIKVIEMNNTNEILQQILDQSKNGSKPTMILQCLTLTLLVLKPVFMYYIQAKYKAPPPTDAMMRDVNEDGIDNQEDLELDDVEDNCKVYQYREEEERTEV